MCVNSSCVFVTWLKISEKHSEKQNKSNSKNMFQSCFLSIFGQSNSTSSLMKDVTRGFRLAIFLCTLFPDGRLICDFDFVIQAFGAIRVYSQNEPSAISLGVLGRERLLSASAGVAVTVSSDDGNRQKRTPSNSKPPTFRGSNSKKLNENEIFTSKYCYTTSVFSVASRFLFVLQDRLLLTQSFHRVLLLS